jgi:hypothetical protein
VFFTPFLLIERGDLFQFGWLNKIKLSQVETLEGCQA